MQTNKRRGTWIDPADAATTFCDDDDRTRDAIDRDLLVSDVPRACTG
jgi:hypothetical protein